MKTLNLVSEIANVETLLKTKLEINRPNSKTQKEIKVLSAKLEKLKIELLAQSETETKKEIENVSKGVGSAKGANVNTKMLDALNALGISDKTKKSSNTKTIFKAQFNNKSDRSTCRTKFINSVELFLTHTAHNKKELALQELESAKQIATKYYNAESTFKNFQDYCTKGMDEKKQNVLKYFIEVVNA